MTSLQKELYENIKQAYPNSQSLDELFSISQMLGHKDSLCERKLRYLVHAGLIEVLKDERGYNKAYKYNNPIDSLLKAFAGKRIDKKETPKVQDKLFEVRIPLD